MIPEIGHFALILAFGVALLQTIAPLIGWWRRDPRWLATGASAAQAQFLALAVAFGCLAWAFATNDFSVAYVAQNDYTAMPLVYRLTAVWGAHAGSLLLWVLVLSVWTFAVSLFNRRLPADLGALVLSVLGAVSIGFLLLILLQSDPFARLLPVPSQGNGLNPILQNPGLAVHPPLIYMGYVGFSVAFAFAIAALVTGRLDAAWARWARPWTTAAWMFLTIGIALGSWWSYQDLGWGGWWFWDPVENASFMPWLAGTALIHSLAVTEKRGLLKSWTVLLSILAFSLCLLGTFLVRSGVLVSVHAFASDPSQGLFILSMIGVAVGAALALFAWRAPCLRSDGELRLLSREGLLLLNNVFLVAACGAVLLGTLYPLVVNSLSRNRISVGPPYFNTVFFPLMAPLFVLVGLAAAASWKRLRGQEVLRRLRTPMLLATASAVVLPLALVGRTTLEATAGSLLGVWIIATALQEVVRRARAGRSVWGGLRSMSRGTWGMTLAHIGLGVWLLGVAYTTGFSIERNVRLTPGDAATLGHYHFVFKGVRAARGPNYMAEQGRLVVERDGKTVAVLHPEKRFYPAAGQTITDAAVAISPLRDLYVSMGSHYLNGSWGLRLYVKPMVRWIWSGGAIMFFGGLLAISDRRYRLARAAARRSALSTAVQPA